MGYQDGRQYGRTYGYGATGYDRDRAAEDRDSDRFRQGRYRGEAGSRYRAGPPPGYDDEDRGFLDRAGDEVRSWFGDEEAQRRREYDDWYNRRYGDPRDQSSRLGYASAGSATYRPNQGHAPYTGQSSGYERDYSDRRPPEVDLGYGSPHDSHYRNWREDRIAELDRDYAEYQRENRSRFDNEFGGWRARRTAQRSALSQVREHMEVVDNDGEHVGTVDHVRGDRILLTKSDKDAGGMHHSIPCAWIDSVAGDTVRIDRTAEQAQDAWRTEQERQALFGDRGEHATGHSWAPGYGNY